MKRIIIFIFIYTAIYANGKPTLIDRQIINLSLNSQFEVAENLLKELINKSDEIKNDYLYLNIELVKSIHAAEVVPWKKKKAVKDSVNKILIDYSEKVIEKYEDKNLSIYEKFYLGNIYGMLGRFYGVDRSWMSAFSNGKEGKNILEEVIEQDPNFTDAYLLLGMMNYYADRLGGVTEFIAGILGLSGDRKVGLEYLNKVEKNGNLSKWQATMILAEIYARMENDKFDALPLLKKFNKSFPENTHFANWYCYELVDLYQIKEAGKIIASAESDKVTDMVKGKYYHLVGNYKKSNEIYDTLLAEKGMIYPWVYEDSKFNQAINFVMLGDLKTAEKISKELNESYSKLVKPFLESPKIAKKFLEFSKNIFLDNADAIESINTTPNFENSKFYEAYYNYFIGVYYFQKDKSQLAEKYFLKSKELDSDSFKYDSIKYLIQIYKTTNANREAVSKLIDEIDDLDNDAFEFSAKDLEEKYNL